MNSLLLFARRAVRLPERLSQRIGGHARLHSRIDGSNPVHWKIAYAIVKKIPRGRVMTYGGLAAAVKLPGGARAAGRAMAACPNGRGIPWHRVVGSGGKLLLREPNVGLQRKLLESEGVPVAEKRILDFPARVWRPARRKPHK